MTACRASPRPAWVGCYSPWRGFEGEGEGEGRPRVPRGKQVCESLARGGCESLARQGRRLGSIRSRLMLKNARVAGEESVRLVRAALLPTLWTRPKSGMLDGQRSGRHCWNIGLRC